MAEGPIVTIPNGSLKGCIKTDYLGNAYYSFQGIPYAKPPIGNLRFKAPQPPESWSNVRDATREGDVCYSYNFVLGTKLGSEDCLFLNVYTKQLPVNKNSLKPVMFWIHGGGFIFGSGNTDSCGPDYLITEDIVLVTINYRLGLLGFLNFDDLSLGISGNAGLKDQVMALKWVNKNIEHFGGDPNNVTIFGESAGSMSVHMLVLSPLAAGLFHKAIMQSGSSLCPWGKCQRSAPALAAALGLKDSTETDIYKILREMSIEEIVELQQKFPTILIPSEFREIGVTIENGEAEMPFITQAPLDIIKSGKYNQVPMIMGFNSREGIMYEMMCKKSYGEIKFPTNLELLIPYDLNLSKGGDLYNSVLTKIKNFYYESEESSIETISQLHLLHGDACFVHPTYRAIRQHTLTSEKPIYLYRMSVQSKLNKSKQLAGCTSSGAAHADDLVYLFKTTDSPTIISNSIEGMTIKRFIKLWTQFAKTGNPNASKIIDHINVIWEPVKKNKFHYLEIGEQLTTGLNPEENRMKFWDEIYELSSIRK